ncbi:phage portal protein [uncultured Microbacterium sp.]|uniref:phage portal protein n=1 Tax=uncultured Microbacterium sp. TaxID=191216 RepID=UPI0025F050DD|nr:phage portal protein [uncultured Microbacterium sp.]
MVAFSVSGDLVKVDPLTGVSGARAFPFLTPDAGVPLTRAVTLSKLTPEKAWKTQPSLRKVVGFIARNVASVPWKVFERVGDDDRQRAAGSPAEQALRKPQRFLTGFQLMYRLTVDKCLYDRWAVLLTPDGVPHRIPPRALVIESNAMDEIQFVGVNVAGRTVDVTELPLALGTGWNAWSGDGVSPLSTLEAILTEQTNAIEWRKRLWDERPKFSGIVKRPANAPKWSETQRTRWVQSFREFREGLAGGAPVFEDGMEWEDWSSSIAPTDALDIEGRKLTDAEVASSFFIPPELVGAREGTFSNITAFRQMLFGPALGPHFEEFEQAFNAEIIPALAGAGFYAEMDRQTAINGSLMEQAKLLSTAVGGPWMERAEARALQNLPKLEESKGLLTPLNVLIGGQASPQDGTTGGGGGGAGAEPLAIDAAAKVSGFTVDELVKLIAAANGLIRSGFLPEKALEAVGLNPIEHSGLLPVTVRDDEKPGGGEGGSTSSA